MEEAEKKARRASVEDKIKKEFSLEYIDKDDPDPKMLKRLEFENKTLILYRNNLQFISL